MHATPPSSQAPKQANQTVALDALVADPGARAVAEEVRRLRQENEALRLTVGRLEGLAYRDPLTGLRSRRYFEERLQEELARQRRSTQAPLSILVIDLDGFKQVNDTQGHAGGDRVLCWVAGFLALQTRFTDVICRLGGDEFVVLLPDTGEQGCATVVDHMQTALTHLDARGEAPVQFSVGSATARRGELSHQLLGRADASMYQEKQGRTATRPPQRRGLRLVAHQ